MNVIALLKFELIYYDVTDQHVSHDTVRIPSIFYLSITRILCFGSFQNRQFHLMWFLFSMGQTALQQYNVSSLCWFFYHNVGWLVGWLVVLFYSVAEQKQDDQYEHTFSNYVRIWDVAQKTCQKWWMIGKSGERGSRISVLPARHDDDDELFSSHLMPN